MTLQHIKLMAFDADDTLWDCQSHFDRVEQSFCQLLAEYGDAHTLSSASNAMSEMCCNVMAG